MDSNHDKGLQRALCYRYTIGHASSQINVSHRVCKPKIGRRRISRIRFEIELQRLKNTVAIHASHSPFARGENQVPNV